MFDYRFTYRGSHSGVVIHAGAENRYNFEATPGRHAQPIVVRPNSMAMQIVRFARNPEALEECDVRRRLVHQLQPPLIGYWATSLHWGLNHENHSGELSISMLLATRH